MDEKEIWSLFAGILAVLTIVFITTTKLAELPKNRALTICEELIKTKLVAPSTYKLIDESTTDLEKEVSVTLKYDASNRFGVPIRHWDMCSVPKSGKALNPSGATVYHLDQPSGPDQPGVE